MRIKNCFSCFVVASLLLWPSSCSTLTQVASLLTCNYNLQTVTNFKFAGINLTNTQDITNLDPVAALKVTTTLLSGTLPLSATVNVGVTNPNVTAAQLAGLDWALFFEGVNILSGETQQQVYVAPNGGSSVVPFAVQIDLMELFKKESKERMLKFANGLLHLGESNSQVTMKIRPAISFGGQIYKTGYITLNKNI